MEDLRCSTAPATCRQRFLEALHFCSGPLGMPIPDGCVSASLPCASFLSMLMSIGACSRDSSCFWSLPEPGAPMRCFKRTHTGCSARWIGILACIFHRIQLVAIRRGQAEAAWADAWIQARTEAGMQASVDGGLMPALSKSWKYISGAPMSATPLTALTRELFTQLNVDEEFPKSFSSHSCKTTLFSWMAKRGESISDRCLHGGHAKLGDRTPLEYSRDALAGPLYRLEHGLPHHTRNSMGTS